MFELEIRFISDYTLNALKKLGSFFTLADIESAKIHPAITQYFSAEIDYLIYLDRQRLLHKSLFDYSTPEISRHLGEIAEEIKKNKLIPYEEARRLVEQAVEFNMNFLLRPRWCMRKFVFDAEEYRPVEEVRLLMNYSYFFDYYKNFINLYIEKKQLQSLSIADFTDRTNALTHELLTNQFDGIINNSLDDAALFINTGDTNKQRLSIEMLEVFLKDRKLDYLVVKMKELLSTDQKMRFELDDYKRIIFGDSSQLRIFDFDTTQDLAEEAAAKPVYEQAASAGVEEAIPETDLSEDLDRFFAQLPADEKPAEVLIVPNVTVRQPEESLAGEESFNGTALEAGETALNTVNTGDVDDSTIPEEDAEGGFSQPEKVQEEDRDTVDDFEMLPSDELAEVTNDKTSEEEDYGDEQDNYDDSSLTSAGEDFFLPKGAGSAKINELILGELRSANEINSDSDDDELDKNLSEGEDQFNEQEISSEEIDEFDGAGEPESAAELQEDVEEVESELFSCFTTKETMRIVGVVFRNDSVDFVNTIEKMAICSSFEEADQILQSVFFAYRVNPLTDKEAALLLERVKKYFER